MAAALTFLLVGCLLDGVLSDEFKVSIPKYIEALDGSCVTIPCSFDIQNKYESNLDDTCKTEMRKRKMFYQPATERQEKVDSTRKGCTSIFNNIKVEDSEEYVLRLECNNPLKWNFLNSFVTVSVKADPPSPTLTPSTLEVKEGTSVTLRCSAPAPCQSQPPALTWTSNLGVSQETLLENQDKTKVQTSDLNFTASHIHHDKIISCTATYSKQDGRTSSSVSSLTASVSYSPKDTTVSVSPCGPVAENIDVTLTCSSTANPPVKNYTWYRVDEGQETFIGSGQVLEIKAWKLNSSFFCKAENDLAAQRSNNHQIDVQYSPKVTTVSVSPCGPVAENSDVTLTCSSTANPPVKNYTWYRVDGGQETFIGSGQVLEIKASKLKSPFFCKAENDLGAQRSNNHQIVVQYQIMLFVSIATAVALLMLVCALLIVIRVQVIHMNRLKNQLRDDTSTVAMNQISNAIDDNIYANTSFHATTSGAKQHQPPKH